MESANLTTRSRAIRRVGTTIVETTAAAGILAILLIVCAQMLSRTAAQQQTLADRRAALQISANAMERAQAVPWAEVDDSRMETIAREVAAQCRLRGGRIAVTVEQVKSTPKAKRICVAVTWSGGTDGVPRRQQLTSWRYADRSPGAVAPEPAQDPPAAKETP